MNKLRHPGFAETRNSRKADLMQMRGGKNSNTVGGLETFVFVLSSAAMASAAKTVAPPLSPTNIFAPASTPAQSIFGLSIFVLSVTAAIFVFVFFFLTYSF